jgi:outer membrane lipopolysaccharide assembly protein LptE/RlpB
MRKKILLIVIAATMTLLGGCGLTNQNKNTVNAATNVNNAGSAASISYAGQAGKTALELLRANHQVTASAQGFVTAIDGQTAGNHQFWAFYVNGKSADQGAADYVCKDTDQISWRLESY